MYKQKIGIAVGGNEPDELIKLIHNIGFEAISFNYGEPENINRMVKTARSVGLTVEYLHAKFSDANKMWSENEAKESIDRLLFDLEVCHKCGIEKMVVHVWIGFEYTFGETKYGFKNYGTVVEKAKEYGVKICFENTEGQEYLYALMDYFKNEDTVGFCWDSGHEMCYNYSIDLLKDFGDRLLVTHLNDNLGISRFDGVTYWTDDLHLLPYDGIADWDYNVERLKNSRKLDIINFEVGKYSKPNRHENDIYEKMSDTEYYTEAYKRACKIAYRYSK
ncbi:MAG: sugar phosphate isomerase/epimerase [Ruminococcaceae bacterium]|nr:sugar phosphate isomerase/epimerase [Oscillospiraceae bacterium]